MKFTLTAYCDNAAFGDTEEERNAELVNVLRRAILMIERDAPPPCILRDTNGNIVGSYTFDGAK